eukprot:CAMPEP_0168188484 /NCGR_PEP_ID=MMETSP0139_2-20121125/15687_1 /TAXON_ID=44445 /ORGANISM="Pseudo-nitzschia australis, Strain 10249 10 AB" /LENGTH=37 /DNA_ID= /DNA_START= /DNA_END= /DNA_ORIENTATION=
MTTMVIGTRTDNGNGNCAVLTNRQLAAMAQATSSTCE